MNTFDKLLKLITDTGNVNEEDNCKRLTFPETELESEDGNEWGIPSSWQEECVALFFTDEITLRQDGKLYAFCEVRDVTGKDIYGYYHMRQLSKDNLEDCNRIYKTLTDKRQLTKFTTSIKQ